MNKLLSSSKQQFANHFFSSMIKQPYLWIATTKMKKDTLFEYKKTVVTCEESMGDVNDY
jgi:hypothetical protein